MRNTSIKIKNLVGNGMVKKHPVRPYSEKTCEFLNEVSKELRADKRTKGYPDVMTFAFWCRKSNIYRLQKEFESKENRIGRGIVFHIAPSNIPVNFAFSLMFGLLAGNANIVRASSKGFIQVDIICDAINKVLEETDFEKFKDQISVVSYEHDKEITDEYSKLCNTRIIWGGDETIKEIRKSPINSRTTEIAFADRYSFGIVDAEKIEKSTEEDIKKLAAGFYNDTYYMDQNACSSPHMIIWRGKDRISLENGKKIFWNAVSDIAEKYDLTDKKVSDKYTALVEFAASTEEVNKVKRYGNSLYVLNMKNIDTEIISSRGRYGMFFEYETNCLRDIPDFITEKVQTCLYYGVDKKEIINYIYDNEICGIDRIVPFGESLDIGTVWDGYDIIRELSRIIA